MNKARGQNLVFAILIFAVSIPAFVMTFYMPDVDAYRFPRMVIIVFFTLGVFLLVACLRGKYDSPDGSAVIQLKKVKNPGISLLIVIVYAALVNFIGFYTATTVFMIVFMKFLGAKSYRTMIFTIIGVNFFIFLVFTLQFKIPLPRGIAI